MTPGLAALNAAPPDRARELLATCCGASAWVAGMLAGRPFDTVDAALDAADEVWAALGPRDWREAFAHHPRIGGRRSAVASNARGAAWSASEQSSVAAADRTVQEEIAAMNAAYEARFGHIYIVCAAGKTPAELLAIARGRMHNPPDVELGVAAEQQRQITRLRLQKLFTETQ